MDERYPYLRFVADAAQVIAGAVGLIVLLGGTLRACHHGGFGGLIGFVIALGVAAVAYVITMVQIETLRMLLDIEQSTRQSAAASRQPTPSTSASATPPPIHTA